MFQIISGTSKTVSGTQNLERNAPNTAHTNVPTNSVLLGTLFLLVFPVAKRFQTYPSILPVSRKEPASALQMTFLTVLSPHPRLHAFGVSKRQTMDTWSTLRCPTEESSCTTPTSHCLPVNLQPRFWLSILRSPRRLIRTKITRNSASCRGNFCSHGSQPALLQSNRVYVRTTCST